MLSYFASDALLRKKTATLNVHSFPPVLVICRLREILDPLLKVAIPHCKITPLQVKSLYLNPNFSKCKYFLENVLEVSKVCA